MIIAYRMRGMGWIPEHTMSLDSLFNPETWPNARFIARNQEEYDVLRGYELVYGVKLNLHPPLEKDGPFDRNAVFLWVDFPVESN